MRVADVDNAHSGGVAFSAGCQLAAKALPCGGVVQLNQVVASVGNGEGVGTERRNRKLRESRQTADDENR